jgi:hypothetical protein
MKAQPVRKRRLSALLLVGLLSQTAFAARHSTLAVHPGDTTHERPADGKEGGGHDPASCSFCRIAPAFGHGLLSSPLSLPIAADAIRRGVDAIPALPGQAVWARPAARAPPSLPSD